MADRRIVILSDLHLGRPRCAAMSAEALRPLWEGATHLILNGDIAEVHNRDHWPQAARQTMRLFDLCETDEVALTLLSGNHDPFISDIRHLHLDGGQIFITHGDVLHPAVAPWSPAAGRIRKAQRQAISALNAEEREHLESILSASQFASHAEWGELEKEASHSTVPGMFIRPWAIVQVLHYWWIFPRLASDFVDHHSPESRFIILGHTHHPGIWDIGGRTIINTGSFGFPGRPRAVIVESDCLSVMRVQLRGDAYRFHPRPVARYELPPAVKDSHTGKTAGLEADEQDTATVGPRLLGRTAKTPAAPR